MPLGVHNANFTFTFTFLHLLLFYCTQFLFFFSFFSLLLSLGVSLSLLLSIIPIFLIFIQFSLFLSSAIVNIKMGPRNGDSRFEIYPTRSSPEHGWLQKSCDGLIPIQGSRPHVFNDLAF